MKKIIDGPGTNKSLRLMEFAAANDYIFVCKDVPKSIVKFKSVHPEELLRFRSYEEFLTDFQDEDTKYVIDDLDNFISSFVPYEVAGFSLTNENNN